MQTESEKSSSNNLATPSNRTEPINLQNRTTMVPTGVPSFDSNTSNISSSMETIDEEKPDHLNIYMKSAASSASTGLQGEQIDSQVQMTVSHHNAEIVPEIVPAEQESPEIVPAEQESHQVTIPEIVPAEQDSHQGTILEQQNQNVPEIVPAEQESSIHPVGANDGAAASVMQNQKQLQPPTFWQWVGSILICIFLQILFAILNLISKLAMDDGMNSFVFASYRSIVAFHIITPFAIYFDWKKLQKMTRRLDQKKRIFFMILAISVLGLMDRELYLLGMKHTTATYATAMTNLMPVITFGLACIRRTEKINIRTRRHQIKLAGILIIVLGAMVMTLVKGSILFGTVGAINHDHHGGSNTIIGLIYIILGSISYAGSSILQTILLKKYSYPPLTLVSLTSFFGGIGGVVFAFMVEHRYPYTIWNIFRWDLTLVAVIYAGVFCSGLGYYLDAVVYDTIGPVYASLFGPLCMIFVAVLEAFLLGQPVLFGSLIGAIIICVGLYLGVWGGWKDVQTSQDS